MLNQRAKMFVLIMHEDLRGLCGVAVSIIHCKICIIQKFSQNSTKPTKIRWNCTRNMSTFPRVPVFHLKYYTEYSGNKDNTDLYGNLCEYSPKMRSFSYLENIFNDFKLPFPTPDSTSSSRAKLKSDIFEIFHTWR